MVGKIEKYSNIWLEKLKNIVIYGWKNRTFTWCKIKENR